MLDQLRYAAVTKPGRGFSARAWLTYRTAAPLAAAVLVAVAALLPGTLRAQDATWLASPSTGDFDTAGNWNPATVPTGTAFFGTSNTTSLSFSSSTTIGGWTFNAGASNYDFTIGFVSTLTFNSAGILINGGSATITNNGTLNFNNTSTAGSATITNNNGGFLHFFNSSTAGSANITNNSGGTLGFLSSSTAGSASITNNGFINFFNSSTAGSAAITNNSGGNLDFNETSTAGSASITNNNGGLLDFNDTSTAGSATITNNNGGFLHFFNSSTAGSANITNNSGGTLGFLSSSTAGSASITNNGFINFFNSSTAGSAGITNNSGGNLDFNETSTAGSASITNNSFLYFNDTSTAGSASITTNSGGGTLIFNSASGGTARFILNGTGYLDISNLTTSGTTAGSIEGAGNVFLGSKNLAVGGNNFTTTFSGVIQDGGLLGGTGGSLTKTGSGTLTLSGVNTYTGGTTVMGGLINFNSTNSFGSGAITLNGGGLQWASGTSTDISSQLAAFGVGGATFDTNSNNLTLASVLSGAGSLTKTGAGMLTLTGVNSYTGGTTISGGTLQLGNGGTSGSIIGNVTDNSIFAINHSDAVTYGGVISGTGAFQQNGTGTTTLTGTNTYSGGTTVSAGILQLGNGGTSGSIIGNVTDNSIFAINRSDALPRWGNLRHRCVPAERDWDDHFVRYQHLHRRHHDQRRHAGGGRLNRQHERRDGEIRRHAYRLRYRRNAGRYHNQFRRYASARDARCAGDVTSTDHRQSRLSAGRDLCGVAQSFDLDLCRRHRHGVTRWHGERGIRAGQLRGEAI